MATLTPTLSTNTGSSGALGASPGTKSFYRVATPGKPASFYEVGTNRYIGPTEFGTGAGWKEVTAPTTGTKDATNPVAPSPTTQTSIPGITDNPIVKFIQDQNQTARAAFETRMTAEGNVPKSADILEQARKDAGLPGIEESKATTSKALEDFKTQLAQLQDEALAGSKALEGQGRGIPLALVRGDQAKLAQQASLAALPITRSITALTGQENALTARENELNTYVNELVKARTADVNLPVTQANERATFEAGLNKPLTDAELKILTAPGFNLPAGETRYNAQGQPIVTAPPKPTSPSSTASTKAQLAADQQKVASYFNSQQRQGSVTQQQYDAMKRAWITDGHTSASFDTYFKAYAPSKAKANPITNGVSKNIADMWAKVGL